MRDYRVGWVYVGTVVSDPTAVFLNVCLLKLSFPRSRS